MSGKLNWKEPNSQEWGSFYSIGFFCRFYLQAPSRPTDFRKKSPDCSKCNLTAAALLRTFSGLPGECRTNRFFCNRATAHFRIRRRIRHRGTGKSGVDLLRIATNSVVGDSTDNSGPLNISNQKNLGITDRNSWTKPSEQNNNVLNLLTPHQKVSAGKPQAFLFCNFRAWLSLYLQASWLA